MKVIAKQKGMNGTVTETVWAGGALPTDEVGVMLSVAQLLQHAKDESSWAPKILSITIEMD